MHFVQFQQDILKMAVFGFCPCDMHRQAEYDCGVLLGVKSFKSNLTLNREYGHIGTKSFHLKFSKNTIMEVASLSDYLNVPSSQGN